MRGLVHIEPAFAGCSLAEYREKDSLAEQERMQMMQQKNIQETSTRTSQKRKSKWPTDTRKGIQYHYKQGNAYSFSF